ncbi:CDGSH iron-sulfur domain-containing protein [Motiliproteus sp. SC1-56]|uniref:CDGSH iron-sulfur domain-containing protein n=1 Tax=Motiliproteus sp. SC1-56 TaxID=2799565 RepID=UPI001A9004A3|nr:CDGSH iron-sulfur domain-containing protein [Motiliproteus sp. SC1-56]
MTTPKVAFRGPVEVVLEPGQYYFCTCGQSRNQPFCDGSHKGGEFTPLRFEVSERESMVLCQCKQTASPPFCDGSHHDLED